MAESDVIDSEFQRPSRSQPEEAGEGGHGAWKEQEASRRRRSGPAYQPTALAWPSASRATAKGRRDVDEGGKGPERSQKGPCARRGSTKRGWCFQWRGLAERTMVGGKAGMGNRASGRFCLRRGDFKSEKRNMAAD